MKAYESMILFFAIVYIAGFFYNFLFLASNKVEINLAPINTNEVLLTIGNIGLKENNVDISISSTSGSLECQNFYNLTYAECQNTHKSLLQYFIKCAELPAKGSIFLSCKHNQNPLKAVVVYNSDLQFVQHNYVCKEKCINELNSTFQIKYGTVIAKSLIPFIPLVKP